MDANGDGWIDEPKLDINFDGLINEEDFIDIDGDGRPGETNLSYAQHADKETKVLNRGITHSTCKRNVNQRRPPAYIKVLNNDGVDGSGGYVYNVFNSHGISDGGWHRDADSADTMGGFFGNTKFYYTADDYFYGSNHTGQTITSTFNFITKYYE